jgi:hypothetical protein
LRELADRASSEVIVLYQNAAAHLALGERERALDLLERAVHEERDNWPTWLGLDPRFAALAEEPRFQGLIAELGFERGRICAR